LQICRGEMSESRARADSRSAVEAGTVYVRALSANNFCYCFLFLVAFCLLGGILSVNIVLKMYCTGVHTVVERMVHCCSV